MSPPRPYPSLAARIEANVEPVPFSGCWIWTGRAFANNTGMFYGYMTVRRKSGRRRGKTRNVLAHRAALAVKLGVPFWRVNVARHTCDVSLCCNPAHLVGGTIRQNNLDAFKRGRR